jgi:hypothetical protein
MSELKFDTYDYLIGGKMVVGKAKMSPSYRTMLENGDAEAVETLKMDLAVQVAKYMVENQLMEFTYQDDPLTFEKRIAVRAYLAPNDQIKILRLANPV